MEHLLLNLLGTCETLSLSHPLWGSIGYRTNLLLVGGVSSNSIYGTSLPVETEPDLLWLWKCREIGNSVEGEVENWEGGRDQVEERE